MKTIWKYTAKITDRFSLVMPCGAKILAFQFQNGEPCIWVKVDIESELSTREFMVVGTGHLFVDDNAEYVGTVQQQGLVWYLFELIKKS